MDLLQYLKGDGRPYGVTHSWAGDGHMQVQDGPLPGQFFLVKGFFPALCATEEFRYDDQLIYRGFDTSPDDGTIYQLVDPGLPVSAWAKRQMEPGDWFERNPIVRRFNANGVKTFEGPHKTWLLFKAHQPSFAGLKGTVVQDVIWLHVFDCDAGRESGIPFETYVYAKGLGMVAWRGAINGKPERTDVNHVWKSRTEPGAPALEREPLPGHLRYEAFPAATPPVVPTTPVPPQEGATARQLRPDLVKVNVRQGPTTKAAILTTLGPGATVYTLKTVDGQDDDGYRWHRLLSGGYVREDLFADYAPPSPTTAKFGTVLKGVYTRGWEYRAGHNGEDLQCPVGMDVIAGGVGQVAYLLECSKCSDAKPNVLAHGIPLGSSGVLNDPAWAYGFGRGVVVRFEYAALPDEARAALDKLPGAPRFIYVIYAHMSSVSVKPGQCVGPDTVLGKSGNTGNSDGPHLHLEARASIRGDETSLMSRTAIDPDLIFSL